MAELKVSQLTEANNVASGDLLDISQDQGGGSYISKKVTFSNVVSSIDTNIYAKLDGSNQPFTGDVNVAGNFITNDANVNGNLLTNNILVSPIVNFIQPINGNGIIFVGFPGATLVVGVKTTFTKTFRVGDIITSEGESHVVTSVNHDLGLGTTAWSSAIMGKPYTVTGGTRMSITGKGDVGIGTDTPTAKLHVNGGLDEIQLKVVANTTQTTHLVDIFASNGTTSYFNIDGSGNTGIGVASPLAKLDIVGGTDIVQLKVTANSVQTSHVLQILQSDGMTEITTLDTSGTLTTDIVNIRESKYTSQPSTDHGFSGLTMQFKAHEAQGFGDACFINSDGELAIGIAHTIATSSCIAMCTDLTIAANATGNYITFGVVRDDAWSWNVGQFIYLSTTGTTGNTLTQVAPSATDDVTQILGMATHANRMLFSPQLVQIEHT